MNRLTKILNSRFATIFCFLFAIANRVIFTSLYSLVGVDTKLQLVYAKNFMAGKGMGATKYFTNDLNNPVFDTQQLFPPGFSFVIIPFLKLFGGDEYKAVLVFDIIVAILFIIAVWLLGKKAGLPPALNNIVLLIAGCSQYFFFMSWSSTDAVSVCLLLSSLTVTIGIIYKKESISLLKLIGTALLFTSPFFFRYMYLPIALLLPVLILLSGFILKNIILKSIGSKILGVSAACLILYFIVSLSASGNALYITNVGRGVFIDQLAECYPFLPASFINVDFGAQLVQHISGIDYSTVIVVLKIINPIFLVLLIYLFLRYINKKRSAFELSAHFLFITIGSSIAFTIILLLAWLSLTYKELSWGFYKWTHVQDPRYFAFIYILIPFLLFVCLYHYRASFKNLFSRFFILIIFCCLTVEVLHGVYYNIKILINHKDVAYIRDADKGFRNFPSIISGIKSQYPDRDLLVCSPDQFYLHTASQMGFKAIFDYDNFLRTGLRVTSKSVLIMPIQSRDVMIINDFMEKEKPRLHSEIAGISFYIIELDPQ
jgi:hypothetical protein